MDQPQPPLIAALLEPARNPEPAAGVELVETHASWVLLAGDFAYKITKPIKLPFLDYSSLVRRYFCEEELRLNRRFAPELEDDLAVLQSTALFLEVSGYKVMQARSLQNALQLAEQQTPDLIVSDYGLRDNETGIQVVKEIRKSLGCVVNAVILTGGTSAERAREAADSDCDIIYKPIKSDVLLKWVHRLANKPHRN